MPETPFETDAKGDIITRPLLGWATAPVAGMAIVVSLNYAETPAELRTGGRRLQLIVTPQQAQELAETLTKQAAHVLGLAPPATPH